MLMLLFVLLSAAGAGARSYSVEEVPNVHVADRTRFLSNPDGIISPAAQARIDSLVAGVRRATSAEMAVVVVDDIASGAIDVYEGYDEYRYEG